MKSLSGLGLSVLAVTGSAAVAMAADLCPTEAEVQSAITHYITDVYWSPGEREIWKITDVSGFTFGSAKFAKPQPGRCAVRVEYSFKVTHADGRVDNPTMGAGKTMYFYRNDFGEWEFSVG